MSFFYGCCVIPGHDVREFFTGEVEQVKPAPSQLAGRYVVSVDRREGIASPAVATLQLNADGSLSITGDSSIFDAASQPGASAIRGSWSLVQRDADNVWCVEVSGEGIPNQAWYVLRMNDGSHELGAFDGDPDQGNIVELKRALSTTTAPSPMTSAF
ncbi:MAG TPA: hypothetical protein VGR35_23660 [Tepidisphaeraceae bacterium]|nr:hypothetical protein [Tepidisphaeraceae bacterium]